MKITELIELLQKIKETQGDLPICDDLDNMTIDEDCFRIRKACPDLYYPGETLPKRLAIID